jgi:hypothetical protein
VVPALRADGAKRVSHSNDAVQDGHGDLAVVANVTGHPIARLKQALEGCFPLAARHGSLHQTDASRLAWGRHVQRCDLNSLNRRLHSGADC